MYKDYTNTRVYSVLRLSEGEIKRKHKLGGEDNTGKKPPDHLSTEIFNYIDRYLVSKMLSSYHFIR